MNGRKGHLPHPHYLGVGNTRAPAHRGRNPMKALDFAGEF